MRNVCVAGWAGVMATRIFGSVLRSSGRATVQAHRNSHGWGSVALIVFAGLSLPKHAVAQAPIAGAVSATVAYDSSANAITLNLSGGAPASVAIASAATHGTATASGTSITYTPTTGFFGSDTFTYTATNGSGTSSSATASITVSAPAIAIMPAVLPAGTTTVAYNQSLTASGGKAPYTFSTTLASGALPVGLSLSSSGTITGTTIFAGTYTFAVSGTDSSTLTHATFTSSTITLVINPVIPIPPGIPTIGAATAGNGQATVTFTPPLATGGAPITSYTVSAFLAIPAIQATGSGSPITVTGLTNGDLYTFVVTATNSAGTSIGSLPSNAVIPIAPPIAGAVSATVAYDSGANPVTLNLSGGAPTTVTVATPAGHGTATSSGSAITYTPNTGFFGADSFAYTATNGSGTSAAATVSITVSAPTFTVTPTTLTAGTFGSAYNQSLAVSGGQSPYTFTTTVTSGALPPGLTLSAAGTISGTPTAAGTYTFTVAGMDSSTTAHASFTSSTITLTVAPIAPGAPTIGVATAGNAQASVAFTMPASNGGAAISSYTVTSSPGGFTGIGSSSPIVVTGLANGTSYTFTVKATNSAGTSAASGVSNSVMPMGPPVTSASSATVAYDSTASPVALSISGTTTSVAVSSAATHGTATASGTSITYTPATGFFGADSFAYSATNGFGTSSAATVSITISPPNIAVSPTTLPTATTVATYTQQLTATGGQAPYTFSSVLASGSIPLGLVLTSSGAITGLPLVSGTFTFTVTGTDSSTASPATFTSSTITLVVNSVIPVAPGPPTIGTATAGNAQATVTFSAPALNGGATITGYTVASSPGGFTATSAASPITVTGLTNGTTYTFTVTATNSAGTSLPSLASNTVTPIPPPTAGATSATVAYNSISNPLTLNITGAAATSVAIASAASHGAATASGASITYTPTTGYFGSDSFTYTATNGSGTSPAGTVALTISAPTVVVTPATLPAGTYASAYNQSLSASGGQAPYSFTTSVASGALPPGLSLAATGAITGTPTAAGTYTFTVSGTDSSTSTHASFTSSTISLTVNPIVPGAPTIGTATAGNAQASVTFTAPASNGGATITSYTVTSSPGGFTGTGSASPIVVSSLANGTSYTFSMTATNSAGASPASGVSNSVTPMGPPVASASSTTVAYDSILSPVTLDIAGTTTSVAVASGASHGTATASGTSITYTPNTGYFGADSFTYTATNGFGTSPAATASITTSPPNIVVSPTTLPSGVALTAYSQSLTASGGQAPYAFTTTSLASGTLPPGIALASNGTISGIPLVAGMYTFAVTGTDSSTATHAMFTSGTITLVINSLIPIAPAPPTIGTATAGSAQASVTFTPPAIDGGAPITSYTVTSSPSGISASGAASPITVTGLTNGIPYTFTVTATNSAGTGLPSLPSNSVTPIAAPLAGAVTTSVAYGSSANPITLNLSGGAPTSVAIASAASHGTATASAAMITYTPATGFYGSDSFTYTATNGSGTSSPATVTINISAPTIAVSPTTLAGGSDGTAYSQTLTASGGQAPYTFSTTVASGALPPGLTISSSGAITGTPATAGTYTFTVSGTDSSTPTHASFTSSTVSLSISPGLPGAPTVGTATPGNGQATVTFTAPASNGGSAITSYTVTASPGGLTASGPASPITVTGLTNGTSYTFTVAATNSAGIGAASASSNAVDPRATQTITFANPGSLTFGTAPTLTATASSGLSPTFTSNTPAVCAITAGGTLTFVAAGTCGIAADQAGNSFFVAAAQVVESFTVNAIPPTAPGVGAATAGNGQATVSFTPPASTGGAAITYTVTSSPGGFSATGSSSPITVSGLANGTAYTFTVSATNSAGTGPASPPSNSVTPTATVVAGPVTATVAYDSLLDPITLNLSGGAALAVAVATPASHGLAVALGTSITYTPTLGYFGADSFTYTATNLNGTSAPATVTINVSVPTIAVTPTTLANGTVGIGYLQILTVSGGQAPYTFATTVASGALPAGLTLSTGGVISGTPATGGTYTFSVAGTDSSTATHAAFTSSTITLTVAAVVPGAPTVGTATAGNSQASVSFTAPASTGGAAITSYTVTSIPGGLTGTGVSSPIPVLGLTNGTAYTFAVTATNSAGTGPASLPSNSVTPAAPTVSITPTTLASGTYNTPYSQALTASGGMAPYTFSTTLASGTLPTGLALSSAGTITGTPTTAGTYTFTVSGSDSSVPTHAAFTSPTITLTIASTIPGAPTIGAATAGNAQATVSFAPPVSTGGAAITYTVTSSPGGFSATGSSSPITITGLTDGTAYTFTVTATNTAGTSAASLASNSVTPTAAVTAGPVTATVAYDSLLDPITLNLSGGTALAVAAATQPGHGLAVALGTSITYTPTTGYFGSDSFLYTATNLNGTSAPATVTINVSAPTITVAPTTLANGTVGIVYLQTIFASGGQAPYTFSTTVASGALPAGLTLSAGGLISGTPTAACTCTFTAAGTDSSTTSHAAFTSSTISLTIAAVLPGAPTVGVATAGNSQASVSFTPPISNGGAAITSYTVTAFPGGLTGTGSSSPITVTGLANGTAYVFTVTATNSAGTGPASLPSNSATPVALAVAGATSATVAYDSTANPISLNVTGAAPASVAIGSAPSHGVAAATGTAITYTPVTGYFGSDSFTYTATNVAGTSPAGTVSLTISAPIIAIAPMTLASGSYGTPYSQTVTASGGLAPYTFATAPASGTLPPGLTISSTGTVSGTPTTAGTYTFTLSGTDSSTATHATFTSATISLTIAAIVPGAPVAGVATAGDMQATITFTPPASLGGDTINRRSIAPQLNGTSGTIYTATSIPGGVTGSSASSPILVTGLTNGTTYSFTITAANSAGASPASAITNPVTPQGPQTITFANPGPQAFGTTPTLAATASSGLAPVFTSTTPAVCAVTTGGALTFVSAGTCTINANQPGNAAFTAAPQVTQSFAVNPSAPGSPTIVSASAGNGQSTITFLPPMSNGGSAITTYTITSSPGGITATGTSSPITIAGLANGTIYSFIITATNSAGTGPSSTPSNSVTPSSGTTATQVLASISLDQNHLATPFAPVIGGGAALPLVYTVLPALPAGLSIASATGLISGTPTVQSPATAYTVTVTDATNGTATATFSLTVNSPVTATTGTTPPSLIQGAAITPFTPITASGGTAPFVYTISPPLPAALVISPTTGQITGTALAASPTTTYTVTVTDASGATTSATFTLTVAGQLVAAAKSVTAAYNSTGTMSTAIDLTNSISGGTATTVTVTTQPTHGIALASGLVVTYLPTLGYSGSDGFNYSATGTGETSNIAVVSITVPAPNITITPTILPGAAIGVPYIQALAASGGTLPYTFSVTPASGSLPAGLTISSTGVISGTPTTACACTFTASGTDSSTPPASFTSAAISLTVAAGPPTVTAISPAIGLASGGTIITITGTGFTDTSTVSFGALPDTAVTFVNATTLTATSPAASGVVNVTVTTAAGTSAVSPLDQFTYLAQPAALGNPVGTALDGNGDIFIADAGLGYIVEVPTGCTSASCEKIVGGGVTDLTGVAVDGNGTLYALSGGANGTVTSLTYSAVTSSYVTQNTFATGLALPASTPSGIAVDDLGNLYATDTQNHRVIEYPWNPATDAYGTPIVIATGSASSLPSGVAVDGNGDVFIADPGTMTVEEITPAGLLAGTPPITLASGVNAQSVAVDASGDVYYSDSVANTITKIPWNGSSFATPVVIATGLNTPFGISVDDAGNLLVANNGTQSIAKVAVDTPPSLHFANTKAGANSSDSPQIATLANIGTTDLTFPPTPAANPALTLGYVLDHAATCPQVSSTSTAQTLGEGASCTFAIDFSPADANVGSDDGSLTATDDNLDVAGATQAIALTATAIADDATSVTLTLNPNSPVAFGKPLSITAAVQDTAVPATVPTGSVQFTLTNSASVETPIFAAAALTDGSASVTGVIPPAAGIYTVAGKYSGAVGDIAASIGTAQLVVTKATPALTYTPSPATQAYGTAVPATALDASAVDASGAAIPGSFVYTTTVNSAPAILTAGSTLLPAGSFTITATFTPADTANYTSGGTITATYTVTNAAAAIALSNLNQNYNGQPHAVTATTTPAGLDLSITYNGSATPPTSGGSYAVVATIEAPDYTGTATGTLVIARVPVDSVTLIAAPNPVLTTTPVTLTATVSSALGTPTGMVNFIVTIDGLVFDTEPLVNGIATFTTSAEPLGVYPLAAGYLGDANFLPLTSPIFVNTVLSFSVTPTATAATVAPGNPATYGFMIAPLAPDGLGHFIDPVTFAITGQPTGSTYTITPSMIPAGAGPTPIVLVITPPENAATLHYDTRRVAPFVLAVLLLPFTRRMRQAGRRLARLFSLAVWLTVGIGITGALSSCAGSGLYGGAPGGLKTYTITLTTTSGKLQRMDTVTLTVQ